MSNTGVSVNSECVTRYNEFKLRKTNKYIVFRLSDDLREIIIDKTGEPGASYDEFLDQLPPNDCRYAVCNVDYNQADGERSKIVFFLWAPEGSKVKSKMLYAGTKDTIKKALQGINAEIQGTDKAEVQLNEVIEKCKSISQ